MEFKVGMKVIFVSQTWLSFKHNDNSKNEKASLLKKLLRRALAGDCKVTPRFEVAILGLDRPLRIASKKIQRDFTDAYIWLDIWSVPQADRDGQLRAISS